VANKCLFLIDGSALAYRSYFAFQRNPLVNSKGEETSLAFGFASTIIRLVSKEGPTHLAVIFDSKEPTFRHKMFDEYKAKRKAMPEEMVEQLPRLDEMLDKMKVVTLRQPGFEADDIIASIATDAPEKGWEVVIVSGDKDLFQLVNDKVKLFNLRKTSEAGEWFDREAVKQKMGVYPEKILDLLALTGDSSDNIPGVAGVGPKTALQLLEEFGSFDNILENADKIKREKLRESVQNNEEIARLSYKLVMLDTGIKCPVKYEEMSLPDLASPELHKLFLDLEFNMLIRELSTPTAETAEKESVDYRTIDNEKDLKELVKRLRKSREFAFDTETDGLDPISCGLVGISISKKEGEGFYIPVGHDEGTNLDVEICHKLLNPVLADPEIKKVAMNFKFDFHVMTRAGYEISEFDHDPMLASYVLDPTSRQHGLSALALKHFNYTMQPITDLIGTGKKQKTFNTVPIDKATFYSAEDADFTLRLSHKLEPMVKEMGASRLLHEIELPLSRVLAVMERNGVKIDVKLLEKMSGEMAGELEDIVHDIYTLAGHEFNINSPSQLGDILFKELELKPVRKTAKTSAYSTDVNVLTELAKKHDLPKRVLDYRHLQKLKSTYVDTLPALVNSETGRVHTSYNQAVAATGRLSSTDPNLQNIPIRTEVGSHIRKAFIPADKGHTLLAADYSQIELRILAHFSKDETLSESFIEGEDVHARTASEVYGVDLKDVTPDMRRVAKTANFAVIYGVSAYGLSQQSDMTVGESREFIKLYNARYPKIKEFTDGVIARAREEMYVTTLLGRRRNLPEINSKNHNVRQFAERTAVNTVIQGTAADMIKIAMIQIQKKLDTRESKMIMQVHDELVFDVKKTELSDIKQLVKEKMESCLKLNVPVVVDVGVGDNWLDCK
jgi:DNA polymerase-1